MRNRKELTFSGHFLIMNDQKPDFDLFKGNVSDGRHTMAGDDDVKDYRFEYEKRYFKIIISSGSAFPRNPEVINIKTKESEPNPRKADQIEPDVCYALIDFDTCVLWISNNKKKGAVLSFLREKIPDASISIKDIYDENNFIETLNSLNEIKFTAVPEIFTKVNSLTNALEDEINLYEAREAELRLKYKNYTLMPSLVRKLKSLFEDKDKFKSIMISGRDSKGVDILFNSSVFARNVKVWVYVDDNGMCSEGSVYQQLIERLENEKE